jgi:putative phage-type endonuclease
MTRIEPGSREWLRLITASKVPSILGVGFSDAYTVWHEMHGNIPSFDGNKATERGTYLEPAALAWFRDTHPDLIFTPTETILHPDEPTWAATPDGFTGDRGIVEAKTSQYSDNWGQEGTAEVPANYLAQCAWQLIVTGADHAYVPVIFGQPFEFRLYVVRREDVAAFIPGIITAVREFQALTEAPAPTGPGAYDTARVLHKDIAPKAEAVIDDDLAVEYISAVNEEKAAEARAKVAKAKLTEAMGDAQYAKWGDTKIASRMSKNGGTPYVQAARSLPLPIKETTAA